MYKFFPVENICFNDKEILSCKPFSEPFVSVRCTGVLWEMSLSYGCSHSASGMWPLCILVMQYVVEETTRHITQHPFPEDRSTMSVMLWSWYSDYPTNWTVRRFESRGVGVGGGLERFVSSARRPGRFRWMDTGPSSRGPIVRDVMLTTYHHKLRNYKWVEMNHCSR